MKRLFTVFAILISLTAAAQQTAKTSWLLITSGPAVNEPLEIGITQNFFIAGYTKVNMRYQWIAGVFDSALHVPAYNGTPTGRRVGAWTASGSIAVDTLNHKFYFASGGVWREAAGPGDLEITTGLGASTSVLMSYTTNLNGSMTSLSIPNKKYTDSTATDWYNVKQNGGDAAGNTDVSALITAAIAAGERNFYFPAGTYLISSQINLIDSLSFRGDGNKTKLKLTTAIVAFKGGPTGNQGYGTQFQDFAFIGSGTTNTGQTGILLDSTWGCYVRNVRGYNMAGYVIRVKRNGYTQSYTTTAPRGNIFTDIYVQSSYGGIMLDTTAEYNSVNNSTFVNCTVGLFYAGGNNRISNVNASSNGYGIYLTGGNNNAHGVITGCQFNHNTAANIYADGTGTALADGIFFSNCYTGVGGVTIINSTNVVFSGGSNVFQTNTITNSTVSFRDVDFKSTLWTIMGTAPRIFKSGDAAAGWDITDVVNNKEFSFTYSNGQPGIDSLPVVTTKVNKMVMVWDNTNSNWSVIHPDSIGTSGGGGGGLSGSGTAGRLTYWTGTSALGDDAALLWDATNNRMTIGGTTGGNGTLTLEKDNTDYTNTGGAGSHLHAKNPNSTGQSVVFYSEINGNLVGKLRCDYVGNLSWVAGPGGIGAVGSHDFYTGGDFGSGTIQMRISGASQEIYLGATTDNGSYTVQHNGTTYFGGNTYASAKGFFGGTTTPTALVHIAAGTASANTAPMKFVSGTNLTTAEAGAVEYNGSFYDTKASGLRYVRGGVIYEAYADVNNSGTGETDLDTYTTPASTLAADGEKVHFFYTINLNDVTATAQIKVYFAGSVIGNTGALTVSATGALVIEGWLVRTSSTTVRATVNISSPTTSTAVYTAQTDLTSLTLSGTNILKVTGQAGGAGGGSSDITFKMGSVEWKGKANN